MATLIDKLNEKISSLGVTVDELPVKTKRKITELQKIFLSKLPTYRDKEGKFTQKTKDKLTDLAEDIMAESEAYVETKNEKQAGEPKPGEPGQNEPKPCEPGQNEPKPGDNSSGEPEPKKKGTGFFDWLFD
jgi:hypothetical protein